MELPKNIVQIGRPDKVHKIFIEDYVVSYIKQLNGNCDGRPTGIALYGRFCEEGSCKYYFLYGAAKVDGLEHRGAYLSQKDKEEIAQTGKTYFDGNEFLAWCCVKGEPLEKLFVKAQGKGVEVEGYACFYEKNEAMLNYMLLSGQKLNHANTEKKVTNVSENEGGEHSNSENSKKVRGDWRASDYMKLNKEEKSEPQLVQRESEPRIEKRAPLVKNIALKRTEYMKLAAVAVFLVLCVVGISTLNDYGKLEDLQVVANQVIANMTEQKLPDADKQNSVSAGDLQGNTISGGTVGRPQFTPTPEPVNAPDVIPFWNDVSGGEQASPTEMPIADETTLQGEAQANGEAVTEAEEPVISQSVVTTPVSYTIAKGDTLNSICISRYGSLARVREVCELNGIANADNIQIGQTILLPR